MKDNQAPPKPLKSIRVLKLDPPLCSNCKTGHSAYSIAYTDPDSPGPSITGTALYRPSAVWYSCEQCLSLVMGVALSVIQAGPVQGGGSHGV